MDKKKVFKIAYYLVHLIKMFTTLNIMMANNNRRITKRQVFVKLAIQQLRKKRIDRRFWKLERRSVFWEEEVTAYSDQLFKENFRMYRRNFNQLVDMLPYLSAKNTKLRSSIPIDKRVAIALYAMGSSAEYRTIANLFGVGRTTVGKLVREFCEAVWFSLKGIYISTYPPTEEKLNKIVRGFDVMGFPQCMGAIDGSHIEVSPPADQAVDYYNYKGWYSIVLLAVVDHRRNFTYINVGLPGRNNDAYVFEQSAIKREHATNLIYQQNAKNIQGVPLGVCLIGDSAFQLSPFLMKPFAYKVNQSQREKTFNYRLSKCRRVVENSFGRLKARFRRLLKGLDVNIENAPLIIKAACVLSNFCNAIEDKVLVGWIDDMNKNNRRQQPDSDVRIDRNHAGHQIRNAIADAFIADSGGADVELDEQEGVAEGDLDERP